MITEIQTYTKISTVDILTFKTNVTICSNRFNIKKLEYNYILYIWVLVWIQKK